MRGLWEGMVSGGERSDAARAASAGFWLACAVSLTVVVLAGRELTFYNVDELTILANSEWDLGYLFSPFVYQLMAGTRVVYEAVFTVFGADYTVLRVLGAICFVVPTALVFLLARRRVGAPLALAMCLPLLFLGTAWEYVLWPFQAIAVGICLTAGLGAFLVLERGGRWADPIACGLLCIAILTFGITLAFIVAIAVLVLLGEDRWRRIWVPAVPLAIYVAWYLSEVGLGGGDARLENVTVVPSYLAGGLAAAFSALAGVNFNFGHKVGFDIAPALELSWGAPLAVLALVGLGILVWRRPPGRWLWAALALLGAYWAMAALVSGEPPSFRFPTVSRYVFPGALTIVLIAAWALTGVRVGRRAIVLAFAIAVAAVLGNLRQLDDGRVYLEHYSDNARAQLTMLELGGERIRGDFNPGYHTPSASEVHFLISAESYADALERFDPLGFSIAELLAQPERVRERADFVSLAGLGVGIEPRPGEPVPAQCRSFAPDEEGRVAMELEPGGALLVADAPGEVSMRRWARSRGPEVGSLTPGTPARLEVPPDATAIHPEAEAVPWIATVETTGAVRACPL